MIITDFGVAIVEDDSHLSKWIVEHRRLDVQEGFLRLMKPYITEGGVVADVGACLGDHTLNYSQFVGPTGTVHAFEPNPKALECLLFNVRNLPNVFVHHCGLGSVKTTATPVVRIAQDKNLGATQLVEGGPVPVLTLDSVSESWKRLDFIKIDAEGWEPDILMGGSGVISKFKPVMLIEVNKPILEQRGWSPERLYGVIKGLGYEYRPCEPHLSLDSDMIDVICIPQ